MNEDTTNSTTGTTAGTGGENTATTGQTTGTTATGTGTQTQTQTTQPNNTGTGTTQEVQTPIDSLPADIQAYIKELREAKKTADKKAKEEQTSKTKAEEAKLLEQNNYKGLLEKRDVEVANLQKELAVLQRTVLVAKVASNHKLPADLAELLKGETEAEMVESASLLAKHIKPAAVNTEGGKGNGTGTSQAGRTQGQGQGQQNQGQGQQTKTYSFQKPGEVAWPS
jgi:hypothetical protein